LPKLAPISPMRKKCLTLNLNRSSLLLMFDMHGVKKEFQ
jgi:hypothetical protein